MPFAILIPPYVRRATIALLTCAILAASCTSDNNGGIGDDGGWKDVKPPDETTIQSLLPDLDEPDITRAVDPGFELGFMDLLFDGDIVDDARKVQAVVRFINHVEKFNQALNCAYEEERLAVGAYYDQRYPYSLGLVVITRGQSLRDLVEGTIDVSACWVVEWAKSFFPFGFPTVLAEPAPRLEGCFDYSSTPEIAGEVYQVVVVGTTDWMCAGLNGDIDALKPNPRRDYKLQTIEDLEELWQAEREQVVARLIEGGYGIHDGNVLHGPGGVKVDLDDCPSDWSNQKGLDGNRVLIGQTVAQSGNLAAYSSVAEGMNAYFDYVNREGTNGFSIEMITKDDAYVATRTIELVDELLVAENVFAVSTLGSPNSLAVYDTLNANCVPHPFVMSGHPAWGDPENHPFTTGLQLSYATEAQLWGTWIETNLMAELPAKVAALVMDNDFGRTYESSFKRWAKANSDVVSEFVAVRHDPAAPSVVAEMQKVADSNADVFIAMTAGNPCLLAVLEASAAGVTRSADAVFLPSVCRDPHSYLIPAKADADGWRVIGGGLKSTTDSRFSDDLFVRFVRGQLAAAGLDPSNELAALGFGFYGWAHVEALRIANQLPGNLSRTNLLLALRGMDGVHPWAIDDVGFAVDGADDAFFIEGSEVLVFDAVGGRWAQEGSVIDLPRSTPTCPWSDLGC